MTSGSPSEGSHSTPARPPARNKSSSSISTTNTHRSNSTTGTGKPRRNKSAVSLHHGHGAGHHNVSFTHHGPGHRKSSHGAAGSQAMKRRNSSQSSHSAAGGGGAGGNPFGLGMTSMTRSDSQDGQHKADSGHATPAEHEMKTHHARPDLGQRRTSSSSSTATVVATGGGRARSKSNVMARRQNSGDAVKTRDSHGSSKHAGEASADSAEGKRREPSTSVTSTGDWTSETDSPLHIGRKLPDVEVQKEFKPEGTSGLAMALEGGTQQNQQHNGTQQPSRNVTPSRLRKTKFQFADDDDDDDDDEEEHENEETSKEPLPEIPAAAMPPTETPALPALPAVLEAITPARTPSPDETRGGPEAVPPELTQETAALQPPVPTSAPQGISPPDQAEFGEPPPVAGPELSRSPSPMSGSSERRPGVPEPSLAQAANVEEPNMAIEVDKAHQQQHQGAKSQPRPTISGHDDSPHHSNKVTPEEGRSPAGPTPTMLQEQQAHKERASSCKIPPSSASQLQHPQRKQPTRKSSNASVLSLASARSAAPSLISRMAPAPHFRRSTTGIAPAVSRDAIVRGEMSTPSPEPVAEDGRSTAQVDSRRNGARSASFTHERNPSQGSNKSSTTAPRVDSPMKRTKTFAAGEIRKPRTSDTTPGGGGALAALGQIHQAATARTPSAISPGGHSDGSRTPGALTHAKRSASGYFSSALRGLTSLPSTLSPPISPSAGASSYTGSNGGISGSGGKHPIPGPNSSQLTGSFSRNGGNRPRSSPSPQQPPLIVKFLEEPSLPLPGPSGGASSAQQDSTASTSPRAHRPNSLSQAHRNASSASLAMSRTQQKALLARDAPYYSGNPVPNATTSTTTSNGQGLAPANGLAPPPSPSPMSQAHPYLPSNPPSSGGSSNPAANANGMQRWAFGLIKEAERIERQWRCIEKWRDPVGESLERVLHQSASRAMERTSSANGSASGRDSGNESVNGPAKLGRIQKGRSLTAH
ncbi:uncharacterized protein JCM15063_004559 [Sporobolomyces koalae]|uniref:uncharacterized protein n=1 Tax=Sporobolomyces koalae TaxID=500713 RepID=UPI00317EE044